MEEERGLEPVAGETWVLVLPLLLPPSVNLGHPTSSLPWASVSLSITQAKVGSSFSKDGLAPILGIIQQRAGVPGASLGVGNGYW